MRWAGQKKAHFPTFSFDGSDDDDITSAALQMLMYEWELYWYQRWCS